FGDLRLESDHAFQTWLKIGHFALLESLRPRCGAAHGGVCRVGDPMGGPGRQRHLACCSARTATRGIARTPLVLSATVACAVCPGPPWIGEDNRVTFDTPGGPPDPASMRRDYPAGGMAE